MGEHQLSLFFSNADGHIGLLRLPMPASVLETTTAYLGDWAVYEMPLIWGGQQWRTDDQFALLQDQTLNMPDLFLMGLETELAMTLTPDTTWEGYPQGCGDACRPGDDHVNPDTL